MASLDSLKFDNTYCQLPETFYHSVFPTPLKDPWLAAFSPATAALLDLDPTEAERPEFLQRLTGGLPLPGSWPIAQGYAGHQFGNFVPQLGDGRAILLGEVVGKTAHVWNRYRGLGARKWDLQLKGSGRTAYSRGFDGRAVLRSCIREFLASEAMHALGIPTTRALAVIGSQEPVFRERPEPGAMLLRVAPSHIRFGTFEFFFHRKQLDDLKELADFTLQHYFPDQAQAEHPYAAMFQEVVIRTAELIAHWQAFGFAHGVMNTDNFSILGITLDYGPFGFLEKLDPAHICNHSDTTGLYAFGNQPQVGFFNLQCLMHALSPLLRKEQAEGALAEYEPALARSYLGLMADKLGFLKRHPEDEGLIGDLLPLLAKADYAHFFRALSQLTLSTPADATTLLSSCAEQPASFQTWLEAYQQRLRTEGIPDAERKAHMDRINPKYILRNYLAQQAIEKAEKGDASEVGKLHRILSRPFDEQPEHEAYAKASPEWARTLSVSCSS